MTFLVVELGRNGGGGKQKRWRERKRSILVGVNAALPQGPRGGFAVTVQDYFSSRYRNIFTVTVVKRGNRHFTASIRTVRTSHH